MLAGGEGWFTHAERLTRGAKGQVIAAHDIPDPWHERLTGSRAPILQMDMSRSHIMGILNVTPDSFSDGGQHSGTREAVAHAQSLHAQGADILDIGGESTRPGAQEVGVDEEIARTQPVIKALCDVDVNARVSIDTRKAPVAQAALDAGAGLVNDVSGFTFDPELAGLCIARDVPVCVMHAQGTPDTMQKNPSYDDVVLDVYDALDAHLQRLEAQGMQRSRMIVDPGIGFGKTLAHNLVLMQKLSIFHGLGVPVLLGASRKQFIGHVTGVKDAGSRVQGSVSAAIAGIAQGVQIVRVHDVAHTAQSFAMWRATHAGAIRDG